MKIPAKTWAIAVAVSLGLWILITGFALRDPLMLGIGFLLVVVGALTAKIAYPEHDGDDLD